jgi:spore maturation protein CgeB
VNFDYPYYASDRLFEAGGRGAFQLFPYITGLDEWFTDGEHLRFFKFGDFNGLKVLIDYYLDDANAVERERIRQAGHEHIKANHTYKHRWETILDTVFA